MNWNWGRIFWSFIHAAALCFESGKRDRILFESMLRQLDAFIPCSICKSILPNFLDDHPIQDDNINLFLWSVDLHNTVNVKLEKLTRTYEEAYAEWDGMPIQSFISHTWNLLLYISCLTSFEMSMSPALCAFIKLLAHHVFDWRGYSDLHALSIESNVDSLLEIKYQRPSNTLVRALLGDLEDLFYKKFFFITSYDVVETTDDHVPIRDVVLHKLLPEPVVLPKVDLTSSRDMHEEHPPTNKVHDNYGHHDMSTQIQMHYDVYTQDTPLLQYDPILTYSIIIPIHQTIDIATATNNTSSTAYVINTLLEKFNDSFEHQPFNCEFAIYGFDMDSTCTFDIEFPAGCETAYRLSVSSNACIENPPHPGMHAHPHVDDTLPEDPDAPIRAGFTYRVYENAPSIVVFMYVLKETTWEDFLSWFQSVVRSTTDTEVILSLTKFKCISAVKFTSWASNMQSIEQHMARMKCITTYVEDHCSHCQTL